MFKIQKTIFTKNVKNSAIQSNYDDNTGVVLDLKLKRVATTLMRYINMYINGNIEELIQIFTLDTYTQLSKILASLKKTKQTDSEIVRKSIANALTVLYSGLSVYQDYQLTEMSNEELKERVSILDDMDKLKEYLEYLGQQTNTDLFGSHDISTTSVKVNQEYIQYIQEYGYPENGVFDPDRLGAIARRIDNFQ